MDQRKRIGIIYDFDENWIGGTYYIQNIVRSLNYLPEMQKMQLHILTRNKSIFTELKNTTNYPKLKFIRYDGSHNKIEKLINRITQIIFKKDLFSKNFNLDCIFPLFGIPHDLRQIQKIIFWIPDFQDKHLPNFFSKADLTFRQFCYEKMVSSNHPIVFSSRSALDDFNMFFPNATNKSYVLQFAVIHPKLDLSNICEVKKKYRIVGRYFMSPNQFWQHKNHIVVIEAVKLLKDKGILVNVVFTGKENDYRNTNYVDDLKKKVLSYNLDDQILFLGFIDRIDQLLLMKNAIGIIQPSLFEGWSTVVEDSKALNQTIIASDIKVHREQLDISAYYFDSMNAFDLANILMELYEMPDNRIKYECNYDENISRFSRDFLFILNDQMNEKTVHNYN